MSVVVGVITAPFHFNQRFWIRNLIKQPNMYFVLGSETCYRKNIMNYLDYAFPYRILDHRIGYFADRDAAREGRGEQTRELVLQYQAQGLISGMTLNPQELMIEGRDITRDTKRQWRKKSLLDIWHYQPFINHDKKRIAQLYKQYNLQDLAELTVSCEAEQSPRPCKTCWWCKEKYWAFGFY